MGKVGNLQPEPAIQHFNHEHPLQLQPYNHQVQATCSCCKLKVSGWVYACDCAPCSYFLHASCSQLPQQINHPYHHNHPLSLVSTPIYPGGVFNCDACGKQGNGFSYHCGACDIDLHTTCATLPLLLTHQSHHHHLTLSFSAPYQNKSFCCDICHNSGSNQWLYRCNLCEFDAHLSCSTAEPQSAGPAQAPFQPLQGQYRPTELTSVIPNQFQVPLATSSAIQGSVPNMSYVNNATANPSAFGSTMAMPMDQRNGALNHGVWRNPGTGSSQNLGKILLQGVLGVGLGVSVGGRKDNSGGGSGRGGSLSSLFL